MCMRLLDMEPVILKISFADSWLLYQISLSFNKLCPLQGNRNKVNVFFSKYIKISLIKSIHLITAVSGVGSSPALAICETSQVLLAGVPGGFYRGSPVFAHLLIGPSHMS